MSPAALSFGVIILAVVGNVARRWLAIRRLSGVCMAELAERRSAPFVRPSAPERTAPRQRRRAMAELR